MKLKSLAAFTMAAFAMVACTNNKTMESGIRLENLDTTAVAGSEGSLVGTHRHILLPYSSRALHLSSRTLIRFEGST